MDYERYLKVVRNDLLGKSSIKRRKGATSLRLNIVNPVSNELCLDLLNAFNIELSSKNWQTKVELIKCFVAYKCQPSLHLLRELVFSEEPEYDIIKKEAAKAIVILEQESSHDVSVLFKVLDKGTYSAKEGALESLGYHRIVPKIEDQKKIIKMCWDFGIDRPKGYTDPRYGLAAACAGWDESIAIEFLEHCVISNDSPLMYVAKHSLNRKYIRLR